MAGIKKLLEEVQGKIYERIENNPRDFRFEIEDTEEVRRKMKYLELHLQDAQDFEETKEEMEAIGGLALAYHKLGDFDQALGLYKKQLKLGKRLDDETNCRRAHCNLGILYKRKGDLTLSVKHYNKALAIAKRRGELGAEARLFNNLANLCELQMDYEGAIAYQTRRLDIAKQRSDKDALTKAYAALGSLYHITEKYSQSIESYEDLLATLRSKLKIQDTLADDASGSSDDDYVDFEAEEDEDDVDDEDGGKKGKKTKKPKKKKKKKKK
ncbi:G-protein-signaling modulator 1-like isoform X2 [Rhopilema esculentum]|uniref:G-protein-signaling modulator 1-like isoform X2 n=1 Tax=Rhopilema esculentum TaxID=499914 RepID=UPI0031D92DC9|eukprot:gene4967-21313_t